MMAVLNKRWLSQGWRVMDPKDAEPMAIVWIERLDADGVPHGQYHELYTRALGLRARRYEQGLECDDFSVEMMLACWPALQKEIQAERDKRALSANAGSQCPHCYGSGYRNDEKDGYSYVRKCDHGL